MTDSDNPKNTEKPHEDDEALINKSTEEEDRQLREHLATITSEETSWEEDYDDAPDTSDGIEEAFLALIQSEENKTSLAFHDPMTKHDQDIPTKNIYNNSPEDPVELQFIDPLLNDDEERVQHETDLPSDDTQPSDPPYLKDFIFEQSTLDDTVKKDDESEFPFADFSDDTSNPLSSDTLDQASLNTDYLNQEDHLGADPLNPAFDDDRIAQSETTDDFSSILKNQNTITNEQVLSEPVSKDEEDHSTSYLPISYDAAGNYEARSFNAADNYTGHGKSDQNTADHVIGSVGREKLSLTDLSHSFSQKLIRDTNHVHKDFLADLEKEVHQKQNANEYESGLYTSDDETERVLAELQKSAVNELQSQAGMISQPLPEDSIETHHSFRTLPEQETQSLVPSGPPLVHKQRAPMVDEDYPIVQTDLVQGPFNPSQTDKIEESYADPEFQALVQWSQSEAEVEQQRHQEDIPHFLTEKSKTESIISLKTVMLVTVIMVSVAGMFYIGYQAGQQEQSQFANNTPVTTLTDDTSSESTIAKPETETSISVLTEPEKKQEPPQINIAEQTIPVQPQILEFVVEDISATAGNTIPMNIRLVGTQLGIETMLLFRGIPEELSLNIGTKREGVWSVPAAELDQLEISIPKSFDGKFDFEVFAFPDRNTKPERRFASAQIGLAEKANLKSEEGLQQANAQPALASLETDETGGDQSTQDNSLADTQNALAITEPEKKPELEAKPIPQKKPKANLISPDFEASMLKRANNLLRNGDVSGARLLFEHLAIQGSKDAAFFLAKTYDKEFLEKLFVRGLEPDQKTAIRWYREAAEMGHDDAVARLSQLQPNR